MKKVTEEIQRVNVEKEVSIDEVVEELLDYSYIEENDYDNSTSMEDFAEMAKDILENDIEIKDITNKEIGEIIDKAYPLFIDRVNKSYNEQREFEESLFQDRDTIMRELSSWFDYSEITTLTLDDIIDLIIKNGNK